MSNFHAISIVVGLFLVWCSRYFWLFLFGGCKRRVVGWLRIGRDCGTRVCSRCKYLYRLRFYRVVEANGLEGFDDARVVGAMVADATAELIMGRRALSILRLFKTCSSAFRKGVARSPAPPVSGLSSSSGSSSLVSCLSALRFCLMFPAPVEWEVDMVDLSLCYCYCEQEVELVQWFVVATVYFDKLQLDGGG